MATGAAPAIVDSARAIIEEADSKDLIVRALGGIAVYIHAGDRAREVLGRELLDIDFATSRASARQLSPIFSNHGYIPDARFNALHGARRMMFLDEGSERHVDIFIDVFEMCHTIPFGDRLEVDGATLPLAELLLTKLQIVHLNRKDVIDTCSLMLSHEVGAEDYETVNTERIAELCADDWGLQHTLERNLERVREHLPEMPITDDERRLIGQRIAVLLTTMEEYPKSRRWRLRARIGERKRWYEEPEEVDRSDLVQEGE